MRQTPAASARPPAPPARHPALRAAPTLAAGPVWDAFSDGVTTAGPTAGWFHVRAATYATDDGIVTPLAGGGVRIAPGARHPLTGKPAFSHSLPHESASGGIPATNDHAKWLAYMNHRSGAGFPGFDAPPGFELAGTARLGGRTFGTAGHPFGAAVADAEDDPRLSAIAMTTIDVESFMVFDFLVTNRRVYALYERLPFGRTPARTYAAFSYAVPMGRRRPEDLHELRIAYDRSAGVVRWLIHGVEVFRVDRVGHRLASRAHMLIDLGGTEETVDLRQLAFGMGLFTLLDGASGAGPGLVRLSSELAYYAPDRGAPQPLSFVDEESRPGSRLFGQGAELRVDAYAVTCTAVRDDRDAAPHEGRASSDHPAWEAR